MTTWIVDPVRRAHDDDRAYLDTLTWRPGRCHFCRYHAPRQRSSRTSSRAPSRATR
ncbi:hypothetical protein ACFQZC_08865 [Streptacidiphilus monticola]